MSVRSNFTLDLGVHHVRRDQTHYRSIQKNVFGPPSNGEANCHAGEMNPQIFEITRAKKVVWQFNRYDIFGNGLACSQILNDEQSALVRKILAKK
jgi:hypothetical protein